MNGPFWLLVAWLVLWSIVMPVNVSQTFTQAVEVAMQLLGFRGQKPRVTQEKVQAIDEQGNVWIQGRPLRATGDVQGLKAGEQVPVLWNRDTNAPGRFGVSPKVVLKHRAKRAKPGPALRPIVTGAVEELILAPRTPTADNLGTLWGGKDVYFRNADQFTPLNITSTINSTVIKDQFGFWDTATGAFEVRWGLVDNTFAVRALRLADGIYLSRWFAFRLNRAIGAVQGSTGARATLIATIDSPIAVPLAGGDFTSFVTTMVGVEDSSDFLPVTVSSEAMWNAGLEPIDWALVTTQNQNVAAESRVDIIGLYVIGVSSSSNGDVTGGVFLPTLTFESFSNLFAVSMRQSTIVWQSTRYTRPSTGLVLMTNEDNADPSGDYPFEYRTLRDAVIVAWDEADRSRQQVAMLWGHERGDFHVTADPPNPPILVYHNVGADKVEELDGEVFFESGSGHTIRVATLGPTARGNPGEVPVLKGTFLSTSTKGTLLWVSLQPAGVGFAAEDRGYAAFLQAVSTVGIGQEVADEPLTEVHKLGPRLEAFKVVDDQLYVIAEDSAIAHALEPPAVWPTTAQRQHLIPRSALSLDCLDVGGNLKLGDEAPLQEIDNPAEVDPQDPVVGGGGGFGRDPNHAYHAVGTLS